jgi:hypothetical protein
MRHNKFFSLFLAGVLLVAAVGCTKDDSGEDDSGDSGDPPASITLRTSCGTVFKARLENPPEEDDAERGTVRYVGPNLVAMQRKRGEQLIKIHGLDVPFSAEARAGSQSLISSLSSEGEVHFFPAEPDCTTMLEDGTEGIVGHLFSSTGKSFAEQLLKRGFGQPATDVCQGALISSCYRALAEDAITPTPTPPPFEGPATPAGFILWKPVSDNDGRLAVHSVPFGTSVIVDGETGTNRGPGNGYGSLARFRKSGCSYGRNVKVALVLSGGSRHQFKDKDHAVIPDGCKRYVIDENGKVSENRK